MLASQQEQLTEILEQAFEPSKSEKHEAGYDAFVAALAKESIASPSDFYGWFDSALIEAELWTFMNTNAVLKENKLMWAKAKDA